MGAYGRNSDGGIFSSSHFGQALENGSIGLPEPSHLQPVGHVPHVLIGDEAFPLKSYLMRPYPGRGLTADERIFNYRLSRARRIVENAFGIAARWRIYHRTIEQTPETVDEIVKATCVLHNFLTMKALQSDDGNDDYCKLVENNRRQHYKDSCTDDNGLLQLRKLKGGSSSQLAFSARELFRDYFVSEHGSVPWQNTV